MLAFYNGLSDAIKNPGHPCSRVNSVWKTKNFAQFKAQTDEDSCEKDSSDVGYEETQPTIEAQRINGHPEYGKDLMVENGIAP
jgi:hypothetical protein